MTPVHQVRKLKAANQPVPPLLALDYWAYRRIRTLRKQGAGFAERAMWLEYERRKAKLKEEGTL